MRSLAEACTIIRRLWTADAPFDFDGVCHHLEGAFGNPKPMQRPGPPIVIGGRSTATLRVTAEHADIWNIPGGDISDATARSAMLDRLCFAFGRDPSTFTRSIFPARLLRSPAAHPPRGHRSTQGRVHPHRPGAVRALR